MTNEPKSGEAKLLPCPFCGGPATEQGMDFEATAIQYGCGPNNRCLVHPVVTSWSGDMDQIIAAWNTHAESELATLRTHNEQLGYAMELSKQQHLDALTKLDAAKAELAAMRRPITEEWVRSQRLDWGIEGVVGAMQMLNALIAARSVKEANREQ